METIRITWKCFEKKRYHRARCMKQSSANPEEVWTALHRTIPFAIGYSLPAVSLTKEQCKYIMAPVIQTGLSLIGIASTIPAEIRHGPLLQGGLGLMDPYIHMGVSHVTALITHRWQGTPTGKLLDMAIDDLVLEMGIASWQPEKVKKGLTYATSSTWIRHTFQFAIDNNIEIRLSDPHFFPRRRNENTIMEMVLAQVEKGKTLQAINRVRMELNVIWISDITTADGRLIDKRYLQKGANTTCRNDYIWPIKHYTSTRDWQEWRKWIKGICRHNTRLLLNPLEEWIGQRDDWKQHWDCFLTADLELLYVQVNNGHGWTRHIRQPGRWQRSHRYFVEALWCSGPLEPPEQLYRASIQKHGNYIEVESIASAPRQWTTAPLLTQAVWEPFPINKELFLHRIQNVLHPVYLDCSDSLEILFENFSNGTMISVSDGSYYPDKKQAACAWIIESSCRLQWIMGSMMIPGEPNGHSAYRSEIGGLLAISVIIKLLSLCLPQPQHLIIIIIIITH
jgi:hypothetical protein